MSRDVSLYNYSFYNRTEIFFRYWGNPKPHYKRHEVYLSQVIGSLNKKN